MFKIGQQANYISHHDLAGAFVWSAELDDFSGVHCGQGRYPLLTAIRHSLEEGSRRRYQGRGQIDAANGGGGVGRGVGRVVGGGGSSVGHRIVLKDYHNIRSRDPSDHDHRGHGLERGQPGYDYDHAGHSGQYDGVHYKDGSISGHAHEGHEGHREFSRRLPQNHERTLNRVAPYTKRIVSDKKAAKINQHNLKRL